MVAVDHDMSEAMTVHEAALDAVPVPVVVYDTREVIYLNAAACRLLGARTADEVTGLPVERFVLPEYSELSTSRRAFVMDRGVALMNVPVKVVTLSGEPSVMTVDIRPIAYNGTRVALATLSRR